MKRIEGIAPQRAGFFLRLFYRATVRITAKLTGTATLPEPVTVAALQPKLLWGTAGMEQALASSRSVPLPLKALASMAAARTIGCAYCMDIGPAVARRQGVSERQILELMDFETSTAFSGVERAAIRYSVAMCSTPAKIDDEVFAALRMHLTPAQIVELTTSIAWENYRARFNHALELEPQGFSEGAYCLLPGPVQSSIHASGV
ncbi:carboxymuconolactone decarboxylase family protein [uncultured Paludibaculum sp.]|uniref:carboxymuconolactone decarboxylase family protein n=1 Tax=uncultured Paludibaculum sp. TaxID=1765020 RepID=UPI002AAC0722|nr:carboxymuconolactone decarboxylase family protein [uncultured Paludibaculum sp.]